MSVPDVRLIAKFSLDGNPGRVAFTSRGMLIPAGYQGLIRKDLPTDNIGDIGHTPGMLAALEKYCPNAEVRLWPSLPHGVADGVEPMLLKRFPKLHVLKDRSAIDTAFGECDFFLHGSVRWKPGPTDSIPQTSGK